MSMENKPQIVTMDDVKDKMLYNLRNGLEKGSTTHIKEIDNCWRWRLGEFNIHTGYSNEGKALDIETYIPTPTGLCFLRDIKVGDQVFDENGKVCNVTNVTNIMYNRPCYKITFSDGISVTADAEHQWLVSDTQHRASQKRQLRRGAELKKHGKDQRSKCLIQQIKTTKQLLEGKYKHSINLCKPVEGNTDQLLVPPYVLGAWLGDGHRGEGGFITADIEILDYIREYDYVITKRSGIYAYGILGLKADLEKIGIQKKQKHIPEEYLLSSPENRLELLKGLMDTDGFTDILGRCEFVTIDYDLAFQVQRLICSLGIKVYVTKDLAKLYGRVISDRYRLRFKTTTPVFKLKRKLYRQTSANKPKGEYRTISSIIPVESVPVKCIEVDSPNHMYLCTEHHIPTHNSLFLRYLCSIKALVDGWKFIFSAPEDFPAHEFFDDIIHTVTGQTTDKDSPYQIHETRYLAALERMKKHFYFVYLKPPDNTIRSVLDQFEPLIQQIGAQACVIDPLVKFARPKDGPDRDDLYAAYLTTMLTDFARRTNTSTHLVIHQVTPKANEEGYYPKPSMYMVRGGGVYADGTDNILSIQRPNYAKDKLDTSVVFASQKIKRQKLVGIPQEFEMRFDRRVNQYTYPEGKTLFDFSQYI